MNPLRRKNEKRFLHEKRSPEQSKRNDKEELRRILLRSRNEEHDCPRGNRSKAQQNLIVHGKRRIEAVRPLEYQYENHEAKRGPSICSTSARSHPGSSHTLAKRTQYWLFYPTKPSPWPDYGLKRSVCLLLPTSTQRRSPHDAFKVSESTPGRRGHRLAPCVQYDTTCRCGNRNNLRMFFDDGISYSNSSRFQEASRHRLREYRSRAPYGTFRNQ